MLANTAKSLQLFDLRYAELQNRIEVPGLKKGAFSPSKNTVMVYQGATEIGTVNLQTFEKAIFDLDGSKISDFE